MSKMAPCLDLLSSFCAGWRFAEQGEPPASPGAHLQSADYGHHHLQKIHLQQHCIHQPTIFAMHCNCHSHQIIITNKIILTTRVIIRTYCCRNCSSSWPSLPPNWRGSSERFSTKMLEVRNSDWGLSPSPCWLHQLPWWWWNRGTFSLLKVATWKIVWAILKRSFCSNLRCSIILHRLSFLLPHRAPHKVLNKELESEMARTKMDISSMDVRIKGEYINRLKVEVDILRGTYDDFMKVTWKTRDWHTHKQQRSIME